MPPIINEKNTSPNFSTDKENLIPYNPKIQNDRFNKLNNCNKLYKFNIFYKLEDIQNNFLRNKSKNSKKNLSIDETRMRCSKCGDNKVNHNDDEIILTNFITNQGFTKLSEQEFQDTSQIHRQPITVLYQEDH